MTSYVLIVGLRQMRNEYRADVVLNQRSFGLSSIAVLLVVKHRYRVLPHDGRVGRVENFRME